MNNMENVTPVGEEVIVESIKDINPDAPTMTFIGNVPVITESQFPLDEPKEDPVYYVPERDDDMAVGLIVTIAIVVCVGVYFIIKHF